MGKQNIRGKEAYCETFLVKMSFINSCTKLKNQFFIKGFALDLALNQRLGAIQLRHVDVVFRRDLQIRGRRRLK